MHPIANQMKGQKSLEFLEKLNPKVDKSPEASALLKVQIGHVRLNELDQVDQVKVCVNLNPEFAKLEKHEMLQFIF